MPAPIVDGKVVMKAPGGRLYRVAPEEAETAKKNLGWADASEDEASKRQAEREQYSKFGGTGQQALGALEQTIRTGTLGILPGSGTDEEIAGREAVLREHSPVVSAVAQGVGALAPALATGGAAVGAAGALGLGARGIGVASALGEGLAGGLAEEIEQARYETRDVSAGNVFLFGLGGELVGRALPKALAAGAGRLRRAVSAVDEVTGEGIGSALNAAEQQSLKGQARRAVDMPDGPERAEALRRTAPQQYERMATEGAEDLDEIVKKASEMGDTSSSAKVTQRLRDTLPDDSPAQMDWFTAQRKQMADAKERLRRPIDAPEPEPTTIPGESIPEPRTRETLPPKPQPWPPEAPPKAGAGLASGDRTGYGKRFDAIVNGTLKRLDKTTDTAESYLIIRDTKKKLQQLSKKMSLSKAPQDEILHEEMRKIIDDTWRPMKDGLKDKSLFGGAAEIEADINASWSERVLRGLGTTKKDLFRNVDIDFKTGQLVHEADPSKIRSFFKGDRVDRAIAQRKLDDVLEGAEDMAAAHEKHGTWDAEEIAQQRERIARFRGHAKLADDILAAKAAKAPETAGSSIGDEVAEFAVESAFGAIPFAGKFIKLGKKLLGIDGAGRAATRATARKLAGAGAGHVERALSRVGDVAPVATMTALERFTGDYSGPQESFEAKKTILAGDTVSPDALFEVLGLALDDLPKVNPQLFQAIAARAADKLRYVREHLPAGISNTLLYPNGTPPSMSALREWATVWNTVMNPESVLDDIESGTATQLQMRTLQESDPDLYEQLRGDILEQVGTHFATVPLSTKLQLDMLLQADGLAGPMFSSDAARMVGDALKAKKNKPNAGPSPDGAGAIASMPGPTGLSAIQGSVTNRGAA